MECSSGSEPLPSDQSDHQEIDLEESIAKLYPDHTSKEIAWELGITVGRVNRVIAKLLRWGTVRSKGRSVRPVKAEPKVAPVRPPKLTFSFRIALIEEDGTKWCVYDPKIQCGMNERWRCIDCRRATGREYSKVLRVRSV
ncbi:MAG TPA: hypothetical protein VGK23_07330 [Methanomassiliicoccales archaeon]|jgi:hypothetical protein